MFLLFDILETILKLDNTLPTAQSAPLTFNIFFSWHTHKIVTGFPSWKKQISPFPTLLFTWLKRNMAHDSKVAHQLWQSTSCICAMWNLSIRHYVWFESGFHLRDWYWNCTSACSGRLLKNCIPYECCQSCPSVASADGFIPFRLPSASVFVFLQMLALSKEVLRDNTPHRA